MADRMLKLSLELSKFDIQYESSSQSTSLGRLRRKDDHAYLPDHWANIWTIFIDGASSSSGSGADIILENKEGIIIEVSLSLFFPTSNNQAEYEAFLVRLCLVEDLGAWEVKIFIDS